MDILGEFYSDFCENLTEFYPISLIILVYLTDFSPVYGMYVKCIQANLNRSGDLYILTDWNSFCGHFNLCKHQPSAAKNYPLLGISCTVPDILCQLLYFKTLFILDTC